MSFTRCVRLSARAAKGMCLEVIRVLGVCHAHPRHARPRSPTRSAQERILRRKGVGIAVGEAIDLVAVAESLPKAERRSTITQTMFDAVFTNYKGLLEQMQR